jgi:hypothetical protein
VALVGLKQLAEALMGLTQHFLSQAMRLVEAEEAVALMFGVQV